MGGGTSPLCLECCYYSLLSALVLVPADIVSLAHVPIMVQRVEWGSHPHRRLSSSMCWPSWSWQDLGDVLCPLAVVMGVGHLQRCGRVVAVIVVVGTFLGSCCQWFKKKNNQKTQGPRGCQCG